MGRIGFDLKLLILWNSKSLQFITTHTFGTFQFATHKFKSWIWFSNTKTKKSSSCSLWIAREDLLGKPPRFGLAKTHVVKGIASAPPALRVLRALRFRSHFVAIWDLAVFPRAWQTANRTNAVGDYLIVPMGRFVESCEEEDDKNWDEDRNPNPSCHRWRFLFVIPWTAPFLVQFSWCRFTGSKRGPTGGTIITGLNIFGCSIKRHRLSSSLSSPLRFSVGVGRRLHPPFLLTAAQHLSSLSVSSSLHPKRHRLFVFDIHYCIFSPLSITLWKISLEKVTECQREFFTTKTEVLSTDERWYH